MPEEEHSRIRAGSMGAAGFLSRAVRGGFIGVFPPAPERVIFVGSA